MGAEAGGAGRAGRTSARVGGVRTLLLHGAGLGPWVWDRLTPLLDDAEAVMFRGRPDVTLAQCVETVARKVTPGCVIVGHSIAAEIAIGAALARPDEVAALLFVGGMVPKSGKPFLSLLPPPQRLLVRIVIRRSKNGVHLPKGLVKKSYCNDLDEATTQFVLDRLEPEAPRLYTDPLEWDGLKTPIGYVKLLDDPGLRQQEAVIERVGAKGVAELRSGHLPMLSQPEALAAALRSLP